jgi:hypothetical protein
VSGTLIARGCDRLLDAALVLLATWTVVYHVSLPLGVRAMPALAVEAVLLVLAAVAYVVLRRRRGPEPETHPVRDTRSARTATVAVVAALVAAGGMALSAPWFVVWGGWLVAAVAGTAYAGAMLRRERGVPDVNATSRAEAVVVLVAAVAAGVMASFLLKSNPDDLFYVNVSQWVAEHGTFPLRDTLYSDLGYPMANWPPSASYDPLGGALAHLFGVRGGTVVYVVIPPLMAVLSVLALWRLLRAWRVTYVTVALLAALLFLLFDGTFSYGPPGNLWLTRLWQGKVILLCIVVPVLYVHLLRYAERPSRAKAAWLFLCGIAAVGLTTSAIFLVPVVALAGVAPLLVRRSWGAAALGFVATAAYALGAGAFTVLTGGRSADDFGIRRQYRFDPEWFGHAVFLTGVLALLAVAAVLLGTLLVPHPMARVSVGVAAFVTGVTFVPGVTELSYDLVGLGPTLWRYTWLLMIAPLVGVLASWAATRLDGATRVLTGVVAAALVVGLGFPIFTQTSGTTWDWPPHWQRGPSALTVTDWLIDHAQHDDVVLAPDGLAITLVTTTTDLKVVAARDYYLDYLRDDPTFHYEDRIDLTWMVNRTEGWDLEAIPGALRTLDVAYACAYLEDTASEVALRGAGYEVVLETGTYRCFAPAGTGLPSQAPGSD